MPGLPKKQLVKPLLPSQVGDGLMQIDTSIIRTQVSDTGLRLLWYIRNVICWGEITIIVKNGEPVRIMQGVREIKLEN